MARLADYFERFRDYPMQQGKAEKKGKWENTFPVYEPIGCPSLCIFGPNRNGLLFDLQLLVSQSCVNLLAAKRFEPEFRGVATAWHGRFEQVLHVGKDCHKSDQKKKIQFGFNAFSDDSAGKKIVQEKFRLTRWQEALTSLLAALESCYSRVSRRWNASLHSPQENTQ